MRTWVKERDPTTAAEAARLAEAYITARKGAGNFRLQESFLWPEVSLRGLRTVQTLKLESLNSHRVKTLLLMQLLRV